jgi:uncharacterized oxidoreductase
MKISGNTILITGGGSGIGEALARALLQQGNQIIIAGRRKQVLEQVVAANPGMALEVFDIEKTETIAAFVDRVTTLHPTLNVLINNAGIMRAEDLLADPIDLNSMEATIATNLLGPIRLTAALLPHFRSQTSATVINVTSGLAFVPLAATPTYCATKAAMHSYTQSLRFQLRKTPVQVIELTPPLVATDLTPGQRDNERAMPLADYIGEALALLKSHPGAEEILVERVKMQRTAEASGKFETVFGLLNPA